MKSTALEGQRILLIGGSKGLGLELYERLRVDNKVVRASRTSGEHRLNLAAPGAELQQATRACLESLGGLDVLIVSSGMGAYHTPLAAEAEIQGMFQVNVFGPILVFQSCLSSLVRSAGKAVMVSSTVARRPGASGLSLYAATKGALNSWVISEARRVARKGIALFAVSPGWFESPMTEGIAANTRRRNERSIPFGRFGSAAEIADFTLGLLRQSNWTLAGQIYEASGGA